MTTRADVERWRTWGLNHDGPPHVAMPAMADMLTRAMEALEMVNAQVDVCPWCGQIFPGIEGHYPECWLAPVLAEWRGTDDHA